MYDAVTSDRSAGAIIAGEAVEREAYRKPPVLHSAHLLMTDCD